MSMEAVSCQAFPLSQGDNSVAIPILDHAFL